ncbi:MAG: fibronectin type III domain-containing protein [Saprospiraceae bacterium]
MHTKILFLFILLHCSWQSIADCRVNDSLSSALFTEDACAPLPPPDFLDVTQLTSNSITVDWGYFVMPNGTPHFKVEIEDLTVGNLVVIDYTSNFTYTATGLIPGHKYQVCIAASTCPGPGDYGDYICTVADTPVIVIEDIVQRGCEEYNFESFPAGQQEVIQIPLSQPDNVNVISFYMQNTGGNAVTEFNLWAYCENHVEFHQEAYNDVVRDPDFTSQGVDAEGIVYYVESLEESWLLISEPEYIPTGDYINITITYFLSTSKGMCAHNKGDYYECPDTYDSEKIGSSYFVKSINNPPIHRLYHHPNLSPLPHPRTHSLTTSSVLSLGRGEPGTMGC